MRVFIDTNILLDVLLQRGKLWIASSQVLKLCEFGNLKGVVASSSINVCAFVLGKRKESTRKMIGYLLSLPITIAQTGRSEFQKTLTSPFKDIEDGFQFYTALNSGAQAIITRDADGYKASSVPVHTPEIFLKTYI